MPDTTITVNLADALDRDPLCLGIAWKVLSPQGESWGYQNDNDLGLCDLLEAYEDRGTLEMLKHPIGDAGHYILVDPEEYADLDPGAKSLEAVGALIKDCHPELFELTKAEQALCEEYWGERE